jgi:hypothetical protein
LAATAHTGLAVVTAAVVTAAVVIGRTASAIDRSAAVVIAAVAPVIVNALDPRSRDRRGVRTPARRPGPSACPRHRPHRPFS